MRRYDRPDIGSILLSVSPTSLRGGQWTDHLSRGDREPSLHANTKTRTILAQQFASRGQVVIEVPFDSHLRPGGVIDVANEMAPTTRRSFYEIAAERFADTTLGPRDQRPR